MIGLRVEQVSEDTWCFRRRGNGACCYAVRLEHGTVLIDTGVSTDARDVVVGMEMVGLSVDRVTAVLLTHWHPAASAGANALRDLTGARVYHHAAERPWLTAVPGLDAVEEQVADMMPEVGLFVPLRGVLLQSLPWPLEADATVMDGDHIEHAFDVIGTPGHTPGHVAFYRPETRTLFCGDALAVAWWGVRAPHPLHVMDDRAARASALRLASLDVAVLCPGHRRPLSRNVPERLARLRRGLERGGRLPAWG